MYKQEREKVARILERERNENERKKNLEKKKTFRNFENGS